VGRIRVLDPTAFDLDPADGSFVVADAPRRQPRVQMFTVEGRRLAGFTLPDREKPRLVLGTPDDRDLGVMVDRVAVR